MDNPIVGIGVPTLNRAEFLGETLLCLKNQTYKNFKVLVTDNVSEDSTFEVFDTTVGDDCRFEYLRLTQQIPMMDNFFVSLERLKTEYFLWRADDDLSDLNYLEELVNSLQSNKKADVAVSAFKSFVEVRKEQTRCKELPDIPSGNAIELACFFLRENRAPVWIYGMWRRNALLLNYEKARHYPYAWAKDHLILLPSLLAGSIEFTNKTWFFQRVFNERRAYEKEAKNPATRLCMRVLYSRIARHILGQKRSLSRSLRVRTKLYRHMESRVGRLWKLRAKVWKLRTKALLIKLNIMRLSP